MRWNILAVIGIMLGLVLLRTGLDTLVEWRAWFLGLSGLSLILLGGLRILFVVLRRRGDSTTQV
jgi:hypothetical protein